MSEARRFESSRGNPPTKRGFEYFPLSRAETGPTTRIQIDSDAEILSDNAATLHRKPPRRGKARSTLPGSIREGVTETAAGTVWACCIGTELRFKDILTAVSKGVIPPDVLKVDSAYTEVIICKSFQEGLLCFFFRFGCIVCWDFTEAQSKTLRSLLVSYTTEPLGGKSEEDDMHYLWGDRRAIKNDHIHLVTDHAFERLAYSYAFAQSVKLAVFEDVTNDTINNTKKIPEGLAETGNIKSTRKDISKLIGELFVNRFYINLHTDILDTPDIFWDNDDFADHYDHCRKYLEIPQRVDLLNHRLDIIKDLYDMLNNELTIQHGYKLEWIVIYLILVEVIIEVFWNILIKDVLHWV